MRLSTPTKIIYNCNTQPDSSTIKGDRLSSLTKYNCNTKRYVGRSPQAFPIANSPSSFPKAVAEPDRLSKPSVRQPQVAAQQEHDTELFGWDDPLYNLRLSK